MAYTIRIVGVVPVIAHIKDGRLFCNAAHGYVLTLNGAVIDEADHPVDKPFTPPAGAGVLQLTPRE